MSHIFKECMFIVRIITGLMLVIAVGAVLACSHIPMVLSLAVCLLCVLSVYELCGVSGRLSDEWFVCLGIVFAAVLSFTSLPNYYEVIRVLFPLSVLLFVFLMRSIGRKQSLFAIEILFAIVAVTLMFQSIPQIRFRTFGLYELILAILVCALTDVAAYLIGKRFGKHKMAPKISPGKTWEGCIGGTVTAVTLSLMLVLLLDQSHMISIRYGRLIGYLVAASVMGQFGDLSMSAFKRVAGVKDFGAILPGHGGILDRFDSQLFVMPFTLLFFTICGDVFI